MENFNIIWSKGFWPDNIFFFFFLWEKSKYIQKMIIIPIVEPIFNYEVSTMAPFSIEEMKTITIINWPLGFFDADF